jgi:hypothetical protein
LKTGILILILLIICGYSQPTIHSRLILGKWKLKDIKDRDSIKVFVRCDSFRMCDFGFEIQHKGLLLMRENPGWCGTPPIVYKDFPGMWKLQQDSTLNLNYELPRRLIYRNWKVLYISDTLICVRE